MENAVAKLKELTSELEKLNNEATLTEVLYISNQHLGWTRQEGSARAALETAAEIARRVRETRLETRTLGWIVIDAFWLRAPIENNLQVCTQKLDRPGANRLAQSDLLIMQGNLKYMADR